MATCTFGQQLFLDRATELVPSSQRARFLSRVDRIGARYVAWETDLLVRVVTVALLEFQCAESGDDNVVLLAPPSRHYR
jgi:hypothetical protein